MRAMYCQYSRVNIMFLYCLKKKQPVVLQHTNVSKNVAVVNVHCFHGVYTPTIST